MWFSRFYPIRSIGSEGKENVISALCTHSCAVCAQSAVGVLHLKTIACGRAFMSNGCIYPVGHMGWAYGIRWGICTPVLPTTSPIWSRLWCQPVACHAAAPVWMLGHTHVTSYSSRKWTNGYRNFLTFFRHFPVHPVKFTVSISNNTHQLHFRSWEHIFPSIFIMLEIRLPRDVASIL